MNTKWKQIHGAHVLTWNRYLFGMSIYVVQNFAGKWNAEARGLDYVTSAGPFWHRSEAMAQAKRLASVHPQRELLKRCMSEIDTERAHARARQEWRLRRSGRHTAEYVLAGLAREPE